MTRIALLAGLLCIMVSNIASSQVVRRDFDEFSVPFDCDINSAARFEYSVTADTGSLQRKRSFSLDDQLPDNCGQTSAGTYKTTGSNSKLKYDRSHLIPASTMRANSACTNIVMSLIFNILQSKRG